MRSGDNTNYYDCRLDFLISDTSVSIPGDPTRVLVIDQTTTTTSQGPAGSCGSTSPYSIGGFLADNPNAVFGVGTPQLYTFTLDTGSTNMNNENLKVCWANVMITTGDTEVVRYAFDTL
mmetsp:Transcript_38580/g.92925  ORF Transcript_38580/g.92925 Transcript_38580/m.92925 type:complete len:119 (+) Transcript_38580:997-1353(+)